MMNTLKNDCLKGLLSIYLVNLHIVIYFFYMFNIGVYFLYKVCLSRIVMKVTRPVLRRGEIEQSSPLIRLLNKTTNKTLKKELKG